LCEYPIIGILTTTCVVARKKFNLRSSPNWQIGQGSRCTKCSWDLQFTLSERCCCSGRSSDEVWWSLTTFWCRRSQSMFSIDVLNRCSQSMFSIDVLNRCFLSWIPTGSAARQRDVLATTRSPEGFCLDGKCGTHVSDVLATSIPTYPSLSFSLKWTLRSISLSMILGGVSTPRRHGTISGCCSGDPRIPVVVDTRCNQ